VCGRRFRRGLPGFTQEGPSDSRSDSSPPDGRAYGNGLAYERRWDAYRRGVVDQLVEAWRASSVSAEELASMLLAADLLHH